MAQFLHRMVVALGRGAVPVMAVVLVVCVAGTALAQGPADGPEPPIQATVDPPPATDPPTQPPEPPTPLPAETLPPALEPDATVTAVPTDTPSPSPSATPTIPTAEVTATATATSTSTMTVPPLPPAPGRLQVLYAALEPAALTDSILLALMLANPGETPVVPGGLVVRYYFTRGADQPVEGLIFACEATAPGCAGIDGQIMPLEPPLERADTVLDVIFRLDTAPIPAYGVGGEIRAHILSGESRLFDQNDDYSFDPAHVALQSEEHVTAHMGSALLWGIPPGPRPDGTATPTTPATEALSPATAGATLTATLTASATLTADFTPTETPTETATATPTQTPSETPTETPTATPTRAALASPTPFPMSMLRASVRLAAPSAPITVLLEGNGQSQTAVLDGSGDLMLRTPPGSYLLTIRAPRHLRYVLAVEVGERPLTLPDIVLSAGDVNGDGRIDRADVESIVHDFGRRAPPALLSADLNSDGAIDIYDLAIVSANLQIPW